MNKIRVVGLAAVTMLVVACASAPVKPKESDLSGTWIITTDSRMGSQDADMTVRQTGDAIAGTLSSRMGSVDYTGTVEGNAVAFGFSLNIRGSDLRIDYSGTVEGDVMKGKATIGSFGEGSFTARRKAP